ncbi:DUF2249 domain-containing protein [Paenibacillus turpanensis]|uniref:DUF2249 domain-containing protein n=1 Tax=Paenibacillus turpanensis TaxID=2689078 RepID=UPI00140A4FB9|nr:DUF2249 domain-containing protein [Paenibacillus turpanensis]
MAKTIEFDARPYLKKKLEPFQLIMEKVKELTPEDTFLLHAPFRPTPLLALMKTKGYVNRVDQISSDHWAVTFVPKQRRAELEKEAASIEGCTGEPSVDTDAAECAGGVGLVVLDNRGLQPPAPMVRTLKTLEELQPGAMVQIHNDRVPAFLIEELNTLGYSYSIEEQEDGSAKVTITKS